MADNVTTQSATPATVPANTKIATREVANYSGDAAHVGIAALAVIGGSEGSITATDVTSANPLPVSVQGTATVSGSVTANAGTNLNTSALALESGGNLAAAAASLATLDNIVAGNEAQVDVVTLPSLSAGTNNIGDVDVLSLPALVAGTANIGDVDVLTVPAPLSTTGGGTEATALRVTLATDSTGLVSVDDNGGSLTIDNSGTFVVQESGAALTALQLIDNLPNTIGSTTSGQSGALALGAVTTAAPTYTTAQSHPLSLQTDGSLRTAVTNTVTVASHAVTNAGTFAVQVSAALPAGANNIGDVDVLSVVPGSAATNLGKAEDAVHASGDVGVMALAVRSDALVASSGTSGDYEPLHTDSVGAQWVRESGAIADDSAFVVATSRVQPVGFLADETATDSLDEGDAGAARMTLDRKQIVTPYAHAAAGGATPYKNLDVDETEDEIKATAGKLFWIHVINLAATKRYIKFYNDTAANVVVGTTVPVLTFPIPTMGDTNGAGFTLHFGDIGVQFATAITVAATTGFADNDTGAPGANEIVLNCGFI